MNVKHIALTCKKEADADWFFGEFLKLKKSERKEIPVSITAPLFGLDHGLDAYNYTGDGLHFEIFIASGPRATMRPIAHTCLQAEDQAALIARANKMGVTVLTAPRGDGWVYFLQNRDGHLFEIK